MAFLYGDLEEPFYNKILQGFDNFVKKSGSQNRLLAAQRQCITLSKLQNNSEERLYQF
jgi:hypothetical protein